MSIFSTDFFEALRRGRIAAACVRAMIGNLVLLWVVVLFTRCIAGVSNVPPVDRAEGGVRICETGSIVSAHLALHSMHGDQTAGYSTNEQETRLYFVAIPPLLPRLLHMCGRRSSVVVVATTNKFSHLPPAFPPDSTGAIRS